LRKLGGVLGESEGLGTDDPRVVVGHRRQRGLAGTATSRRAGRDDDVACARLGRRPIDLAQLHDGFTVRLEARIDALHSGSFDLADVARSPGHDRPRRRLQTERGIEVVRALGLDAATGALVVGDPHAATGERLVHAGDVVHLASPRCPAAADCRFPGVTGWHVRCSGTHRASPPSPGSIATVRPSRRARRDPARFEALYRKYLAQVYSYALYELGDHHAAEDATERRSSARLAALPRFEERAGADDPADASTFRVWLFRIARNAIANERRTARRRPSTSLEASLEAGLAVVDPQDVEADAVRRDDAAAAIRAVQRLPADRRRAVVLRLVDELSTAEIAGILGRSEGAVRVLLHRALRAVARDLSVGRESGRKPHGTMPAERRRDGWRSVGPHANSRRGARAGRPPRSAAGGG
jgi:RNA polymerase sigma-70 factor (ECF subfamily)